MKKFLKATFSISWFQVIICSLFGLVWLVRQRFSFSKEMLVPAGIVVVALAILYTTLLAVVGKIEDDYGSHEAWLNKTGNQWYKKGLLKTFDVICHLVLWAVLLAFALFIYPNTGLFVLGSLISIFIGNIIAYFKKSNVVTTENE